jgi:hypothetical protein
MIDFVIPCHPKDFPSLKLSVMGILKNISSCNRLFVVSKENPNLDNVIHIPEDNYFSYITIGRIEQIWKTKNPSLTYRSKWIYQQLLKLLTVKVIENLTESFVLVDADTIFLRDVLFDNNKFNYSKVEDYHKPYHNPTCNLLNIKNTIGFSTIAHHCIFHKEKITKMIDEIENRFNKTFVDIILDIIDYDEASCLSEWDLYANYMILNFPEMCQQRQLFWEDISFIPVKSHLDEFKEHYDFVSCHAYRRGIE